jgi:hypothetical protein
LPDTISTPARVARSVPPRFTCTGDGVYAALSSEAPAPSTNPCQSGYDQLENDWLLPSGRRYSS